MIPLSFLCTPSQVRHLAFILLIFPAYINASGSSNSTLNTQSKSGSKVLKLYHDADWSNHRESAEAIWRGVNVALNEINYTIHGHRIELVRKDHSGNTVRSFKHMKQFLADPNALAVVSGIHSPPLIRHRDFINENKILMLVPWAAGSPITRYPSPDNWIFRVSVDDSKAGKVLLDYAVENKRCSQPHLLLENTAWGQSNLDTMTAAMKKHQQSSIHVTRFDWNMKGYTARSKVQEIIFQHHSDCIILVANAIEGKEIAKAMASVEADKRIPIISHWGITGGDFPQVINAKIRQQLDLSFIQTCFSFLSPTQSNTAVHVLNEAKNLYPDDIKQASDIHSPAGFIHGYDLTLLLINALKQVTLTPDSTTNRSSVRLALEMLNDPIEGLLKTYQQPFSVFGSDNLDAHEALSRENLCMAQYGSNNEIILLTNRQ